jgi:protein-disulfide isomerase
MNKSNRLSKRELLKEKRRKQQYRQRNLFIGFIIVIALIVAAILIYPSLIPEKIATITPVARPNEQGLSIGDPNAPVKVVEFADFQCPACKLFYTDQEPAFESTYVATGKVYYTYSPFSFIDQHDQRVPPLQESHAAAEAAYCASDQGKFWEYHDMIYTNQTGENIGDFTQKRLAAFAQALGLDMSQFNSCYSSGKYTQKVIDGYNAGIAANVTQTPSFIVNGKLVTLADLQTTIDADLVASSSSTSPASPSSTSTETLAATPTQ